MSRSQTTSQSYLPEVQHCTRCGTIIPPTATFCGNCGTRVEKSAQTKKDVSPINGHVDLSRYRITSLMRRTPYTQLSLAIDTQQQQPVAIRDIIIQQIDVASRPPIFDALQQEYDLLRQKNIDDILPIVFSFHTEDHLYSISAWPFTNLPQKSKSGSLPRLYTLQDILQSGIGLPDEQLTLSWILRLANAIEHLHRNNIVIGTLDPSTILINQKDYTGQPALFTSWVPSVVQVHIQQALNTTNASQIAQVSAISGSFFAPEAKQGQPEIRSDIYSLGAILYLLVTGIAPTEQSVATPQHLRSPREINSRVQPGLATTILKALSREPSARFQSIYEFTTALLRPPEHNKAPQRFYNALLSHNKTVEKAGPQLVEINITSDKDNNKTNKGKEVYARPETNDETVSINPSQNQLARRYMSRVDTQQLGREQLNSVHEEPMTKNGRTTEENIVGASSTKKGTRTEAELDNKSDQVQILSPASDTTTKKATTAEAVSETAPSAKEEIQEIGSETHEAQQGQNESAVAVLDVPPQPEEVSDTSLDIDANNTSSSHADSEQANSNSHSADDSNTITADHTPEAPIASTILNETAEIQPMEAPADDATKLQAIEATEQDEQKPEDNAAVPLDDDQERTQLVALKTQEPPSITPKTQEPVVPDDQAQTQPVAQKTQASTPALPADDQEQTILLTQPRQNRSARNMPADTKDSSSPATPDKSSDLAPSPLPPEIVPSEQDNQGLALPSKTFSSLLERVKRFVLGGQPRTNNAVAMIETPMRIQPNKNYTIRIHVMGRDEPKRPHSSKQNNDNAALGGLGSLIHGDVVHIEVRSALYHNYAYIVQQTDIEVPGHNYAAEITIPMRSITDSSGTRRERLHIFFTDEKHNPLYEKPFLIELFISSLVQSGHEGHNVLSIPV
jgi:serine/threonine protein kinase/ribosomal protein L40E